jgi:preprotein translocase subunit SecE
MERSLERYVAIAYVLAGMLVALVVSRGIHAGLFYAGVEDYPVLGADYRLSAFVGVALAAGTAIFCYRHPNVKRLSDEVALELSKVTWPTRQETWAATLVVIVTVAISSLYLGLFDAVWLWASNAVLTYRQGS